MSLYWKAVRRTDNPTLFVTGGIGGSEYTEFKIGETYQVEDRPTLCKNGFHFYKQKNFVFGLTLFEDETEFLEIEPLEKVISDTEKLVCTKIKIIRHVPKEEWSSLVKDNNSGDYNSGDCNSGYKNSGNCNSGNYNSGDKNSGNCNSGNCNSGYYNSGYKNSGDYNSGDCNSGYYNSGYKNSGNYNSGNYNSGNGYNNYFCTKTKYFVFDIETSEETINKIKQIDMSWFDLKDRTYKEAWSSCPKKVLEEFLKIEEFRTSKAREKFKEITGLRFVLSKPLDEEGIRDE